MSVISAMFEISKPFHSESRTIWHVVDRQTDEIVTTLEIGSEFRYASGNVFEVVSVDQPNNRVTVARVGCRTVYTWYVGSLLSGLKVSA